MTETVAPPRHGEVRQGLISKSLTALARTLQWLALSLLFSILIEWAGMVWWWPDQGLAHSRKMLGAELSYLESDFRRSVLTSDPARFTRSVADKTYHVLFEVTRFVDFIEWVSMPVVPGEHGVRATVRRIYRPMAKFVIAAMQMTQVFSVRLALLTLAMPVFVLFALVALVDGLVQRDLRRFGGGRESSFVYHWVKQSVLPLLVLTWVVYLALPFSLHPNFIVLPFATLFALCIAVTASTFKKYL